MWHSASFCTCPMSWMRTLQIWTCTTGGTPHYAPTDEGSAASEGLSPVTPTSVRNAVESSNSGAESDGKESIKPDSDNPWTDNTNFPDAFLSSADAQALVDSYTADPSLPHWQ